MKNISLIIVEDEAIIAADLASVVEREGIQVLGTASNAAEAIEIATKMRPHLALMDINLDGPSSGIEAAQTIQKLCDNLPVIFLTGMPEINERECADLNGPHSFISKPFDKQSLLSEIENVVNHRQRCA